MRRIDQGRRKEEGCGSAMLAVMMVVSRQFEQVFFQALLKMLGHAIYIYYMLITPYLVSFLSSHPAGNCELLLCRVQLPCWYFICNTWTNLLCHVLRRLCMTGRYFQVYEDSTLKDVNVT
uniref:Uncharacterized protein n=1 Tax=Oryza meridionalis TaxID=40149 RepID=A0A0E0D014_9ORYZ